KDDKVGASLVAYKLPSKSKQAAARSPKASAPVAANPDEFGRTPLHDAALAGKIDAAAKLLAGGADPNAGDAYQTTPLHLACRGAHLAMVRELVESGASVNAINAAGSTPLHEAALGGDRQIVEFLLLHGANRLARDRRQMTAADVAAARHNDRIASMLR
ncbi:MAG TPA: ankyrin repeat domain-containing protein, partial [Tepidisphaeraceae bacterium]|nr:ankyrin repeat domain-containing protein [Tepidisphaeraceae bacterium]